MLCSVSVSVSVNVRISSRSTFLNLLLNLPVEGIFLVVQGRGAPLVAREHLTGL